jgi:hypothetical protein
VDGARRNADCGGCSGLSGQPKRGSIAACAGSPKTYLQVLNLPDPTDSVDLPQGTPYAPAVPPPLPPPLPPQALRSRNYFVRHWRGELSLPVSYWLNGVLGGLMIGVIVGGLAYLIRIRDDAQPLMWLASLTMTWVAGALLAVWQTVGVWRSAIR